MNKLIIKFKNALEISKIKNNIQTKELEKGGEGDMGKIIKKNVVDREPGFLYYVDGQGNVCRSKMKSRKKSSTKKTKKKKK